MEDRKQEGKQERRNPLRACASGGVWGSVKLNTSESPTKSMACLGCLCFGLPDLCVLACPMDEKDAYHVNGKVRFTMELNAWHYNSCTPIIMTVIRCITIVTHRSMMQEVSTLHTPEMPNLLLR